MTSAGDHTADGPSADEREGDLARRPVGTDDATVEAVGRLTEALEWVERARGSLYDFHQRMGHADRLVGDASERLRSAGHEHLAKLLSERLVGLNAMHGRWSFQMVEEFDDGYWSTFRAIETQVRDELTGGARHVAEAEMKQRRRSPRQDGHEATPAEGA